MIIIENHYMKGGFLMKKTIIIICFCLVMLMMPDMANAVVLKKGFHKIADTNISPDTTYTVQNTSFNERIYMLIFDTHATPLQGIRLKPQSIKYNLVSLQPGYKIVLIGEGEIDITPSITVK